MSKKSGGCGRSKRATLAKVRLLMMLTVSVVTSMPVQAQDLVHRFIDPSFGGNPFYSDHLLAIAAIHRPAEPSTADAAPTDEDLLAQQLRARLLSQLSGDILDRIQNAVVGDTGNFEFGNQKVNFVRTATETTVTFTNTTTGETNTVVLPVTAGGSGAVGSRTALTSPASVSPVNFSAENALGASGRIAALGATGQPGGQKSAVLSAEQALGATGTSLTKTDAAGSVLPPF